MRTKVRGVDQQIKKQEVKMPNYRKKCMAMVVCPKCEWTYIPAIQDWNWHNKNCEYVQSMNKKIRSIRKNELPSEKEYFKKMLGIKNN